MFWQKKNIFHQLRRVLGRKKVLTDPETLAIYSFDATTIQGRPSAVVFPESTPDVQAVIAFAAEREITITPRGAGSGLSGGSVPVEGGIVISFERMRSILDFDVKRRTATVQPGVVTATLQAMALKSGLFYPPDPSSHTVSTIGGNIAENAGGLRCFKYGVTSHYVLGLEVIDAEANRIYTGTLQADKYDPDLTQILVGSEGTLGLITQAQLGLISAPAMTSTIAAHFSSKQVTFETVQAIISEGLVPSVIEYIDRNSLEAAAAYFSMEIPHDTAAMLLIEIDGDNDEVELAQDKILALIGESAIEIKIASDTEERDELWKLRRAISPSLIRLGSGKLHEDIAVPRSRLAEMAAAIELIAEEFQLKIPVFGHAGDGNLHAVLLYDVNNADAVVRVKDGVENILKTAIELGGTITGEHGIGAAKQEYLGWQHSDRVISTFGRVKSMLDPQNIFNPGKVLIPGK